MLERLAQKPASLARRQPIAKSRLQVGQTNLSALPIENRHEQPKPTSKQNAASARQQRDQLRRQDKSNPFNPIAKPFPTSPHFASYTRRSEPLPEVRGAGRLSNPARNDQPRQANRLWN